MMRNYINYYNNTRISFVSLFTVENAAQKTRPTLTSIPHHLPHSAGGVGAKVHGRFIHFL